MTRPKLFIIASCFILIGGVAIITLEPGVVAVRKSYFDVENGRMKVEISALGHVYSERIEENEYSRLLKRLGYPEQAPDWRRANVEALGICRWSGSQHNSYNYGRIAADARMFAIRVDVDGLQGATLRKDVAHLRDLILSGDAAAVKLYALGIQKTDVIQR